jgi:hypothetical protein
MEAAYGPALDEHLARYNARIQALLDYWRAHPEVMGGGLARRDVTAAQPAPLMRRSVSGATPAEGAQAPESLTTRAVRQELGSLRERIGPRADFLLAWPGNLPLRYRAALREQGLTPENFRAFYDIDTHDLVVNPRNITSRAQLNDIVNRNFIPNTFRNLASIRPLDSWHQAADNPAVARLLARDPHADTTTSAL